MERQWQYIKLDIRDSAIDYAVYLQSAHQSEYTIKREGNINLKEKNLKFALHCFI